MSRSVRDAPSDNRETRLDVQEWSRAPSRCPGVIGRPYRISGRIVRMSGSVRETLPYVR